MQVLINFNDIYTQRIVKKSGQFKTGKIENYHIHILQHEAQLFGDQ